MAQFILFFISGLFIFGCAHHKNVVPAGKNGEHSLSIQAKSDTEGMKDAVAEATSYCKQSRRVPNITSSEAKYSGDMDEGLYKQSQKIKDAASVFAQGAAVGRRASQAADNYLGEPYEIKMKFRCE